PIEPELETVELATWGDSGYGTWAEPILARFVPADAVDGGARNVRLRCAGLVVTGQVQTPSADFVMRERVTAPGARWSPGSRYRGASPRARTPASWPGATGCRSWSKSSWTGGR